MPSKLPPKHKKPWSDRDKELLIFHWGVFSLKTLGERLDRTPWAVAREASALELGPFSKGTISISQFEKLSGFSRPKIFAAAEMLKIKLSRSVRSDPLHAKIRNQRPYSLTDEQQEALLEYMLEHEIIFKNREGTERTSQGVWGVGSKPAACTRCERSDRPHFAKGLCASCYSGVLRQKKKMNDTIPIIRFTGTYRFLSNFFPSSIEYEGAQYYSVEHAYQASKTLDLKKRTSLQFTSGTNLSVSPNKAKSWGRAVNLRKDWEEIKLQVMEDLLHRKFEIGELRRKLLDTKERELMECNTWNDRFWGKCELGGIWEGENHLGKLLMKVRTEIRNG